MQLIERLKLYSDRPGCPFVGLPFADGSKMIFKRKLLQAALESPVCKAELTDEGVLLTGGQRPPSALYHLFDLLRVGHKRYNNSSQIEIRAQIEIRDQIMKWAAQRRNARSAPKAIIRFPVARKHYERLDTLQKEITRKFGHRAYGHTYQIGSEERPDRLVNPLCYKGEGCSEHEGKSWLKWKMDKPLRRRLSVLAIRKGRREITWREFYREFQRIVGNGPTFKHTQKAAELYNMYSMVAAMAGQRHGYRCQGAREQDSEMEKHIAARKEQADRVREFNTLSELIADQKERIHQLEELAEAKDIIYAK